MRPGRSLSVRAINVKQRHDGDEGRRAGRFRVGDVFFIWNRKKWRVLDLSATGLRLQLTGRLRFRKGDRIGVTLQWEGVTLPLRGTIVWVRRVGRKAHMLGVSFDNLNASEAAAVQQLVMHSAEATFIDGDAMKDVEESE